MPFFITNMNEEQNKYLIALGKIDGIGSITLRKLISFAGSAKNVFSLSYNQIKQIPRVTSSIISELKSDKYIRQAEEELAFCDKNNVEVLNIYSKNYPSRLKNCKDAPLVLFYRGNCNLNNLKIIGIVGTRNFTAYGKQLVDRFLSDLAASHDNVLVVSGLAYGIDQAAHRAALKNNIPTVGVMGNGIDTIYPAAHRELAVEMLENGGILTEFTKGVKPDAPNFVKRNRIIAGMCDAVIVVESKIRGGSLITADLAFSYNRDVFAFPGKVGDVNSEGCNKLIKSQKAALIESVSDLEYIMNWIPVDRTQSKSIQKDLFSQLTIEEQTIMELILEDDTIGVDYLCGKLGLPISQLSPILLSMELKGVIKSVPGNQYSKLV